MKIRANRSTRIVKEFDFFDEKRSGPMHAYVLPALKAPLKEIMFPQILNSPAAKPPQESDDRQETSAGASSAHRRKKRATAVDDDDDRAMKRISKVGADKKSEDGGGGEDSTADEGEKKIPSRKRKSKKNPNTHQEEEEAHPAPIPPLFGEQIQLGQQPILLFEKKLENSDLYQSQNRLLITGSERLMAALTEEEREIVEREGDKAAFLEVVTTAPNGVDYAMRLEKWGAIVLNHEWFKLARAHELKKGDSVQGWGYRPPNHKFRLTIKILKNLQA